MKPLLPAIAVGLVLACGPAPRPDVPAGAVGTGAGAGDGGDARVEARLLIDRAVAVPGEPVRVGVLFTLDPGWHLYWRNPGQSGLPTKLDWELEGGEVGPIAWPAPSVYRESDGGDGGDGGDGALTTYGYEDAVLLASEAAFHGATGARRISVRADFLVCEIQCVPGRIRLERELELGSEAMPADALTLALFERAAATVPQPAADLDLVTDALYSQSAIRPGDRFRAAVAVVSCGGDRAPDCAPLELAAAAADAFVPEKVEGVSLEVTGSRPHPFSPGDFVLTLSGRAGSGDPGAEQRLAGVLKLRTARGEPRFAAVDFPLPRAAAGAEITALDHPWLDPAGSTAPTSVPFAQAILLALVGGLILNLMPCVLPVLAIKLFGVAEMAHRSRRVVLAHGLAYTAGITTAMLALAAAVAVLRAAGTAVGWGFQFQEPLFVAAICAVLVVFALNLFGVFEIYVDATAASKVGEEATGARRSFFEGLLAVVVATPCSAPFLGTAIGFAFASSTAVIFGIFVAVGLGLAAPYVLVTLVPAWSRVIPRPGAWMVQVRRALGFALIATAVWLLWVIGRSVGTDGMALLLGFLVMLAGAVWIYGALQTARLARPATLAGVAAIAFAVFGLASLPLDAFERPAPGAEAESSTGDWLAFDPAAIRAELAAGRPAFVYFTADWCLSCKVNERLVLDTDDVQRALAELDYAMFKADWTRRDETIRRELARFGKAGVPMYLVYGPASPGRPEVLPELLTVDLMVDALRRAATNLAAVR